MRIRHWKYILPLRLRSIFKFRDVEHDLDDELRFHLEMKVEDGLARGLTPSQARIEALRAMDGLEQRKEEIRDMRHIHWLSDFLQDLRYAWRGLWRVRGFTAFVVVTLALGIGLNTAIFSLADALMLRPLPVPDPGKVVNVVSTSPTEQFGGFSWSEYLDFRNRSTSFEGLAAFTGMTGYGISAHAGELPQLRGGVLVSANFFRVLRVEPTLGRGFLEDEFRVPGRDAVIVLGHGFWMKQFGGDVNVIGRELRLNGAPFRIVGVAPEQFTAIDLFNRPDFYAPLAMWPTLATDIRNNPLEDRNNRALSIKGRLKPGVAAGTAQVESAVLARDLARAYPETNRKRGAAVYTDLQIRMKQDTGDAIIATMLSALAAAVLLVACANVAGLLLSRARARSREIAVRLSIGATRSRLIRLLLTESLLLAFIGGAFGLMVAYGGVKFLGNYRIPSELPIVFSVELNSRVLAVSLLTTLLSAFLFGLAPAIQTTRTDLVTSLKTAGVDLPGKRRLWGRNALVIAQVACSLTVLTVAVRFIEGVRSTWSAGGGYRTDHLLLMSFDPRIARFDDAQTQQFYRDLLTRAAIAPGVKAATLTESIPMGFPGPGITFVPEAFQMPRDRENFSSYASSIGERYFDEMKIPLLRGRAFLPSDKADATRVAVVNEVFARHYWPGKDAIGKRFRLENGKGPLLEIVGVAKTGKYVWIGEPPTEFVYLPFTQRPRAQMTLLAESSGDPTALAGVLREAVGGLNSNIPIYDVRTMDEFYRNRAYSVPLMIMQTISAMGLVGLLLAVTGLYGLIAYAVSRRTREIGIRMAIGAGRGSVIRMVLGQGFALVISGTVLGLLLGLFAGKGVDAMFPVTGPGIRLYLFVVPCLVLVTMIAAYVPARRASRVNPVQALREE